MKIGIFDSGIGGLTVLKKLIDKYPNSEYIYYGDTKNIPFGNKSIEELKIISNNIIEFLIGKGVDIIVIACGTISSNLANYLRKKYNIPIYDIISSVVDYINNSEYKNIGVLCTKQTKESKIFETKINKKVKVISCNHLASLIETNIKVDLYLKEKLSKLNNNDVIILGCTHYPLVIDNIKKHTNTKILDMSDYLNLNIDKSINFKLELYFSKIDNNLLNNVKRILKNYKYTIKNK